ncbi:MAG: hypothetical protein ILA02_07695 [Clostridia bacterium]|nr:hypothetical protein [Clostridia bacterium]
MEDFQENIEDLYSEYTNDENSKKIIMLEEKKKKNAINHEEYKEYCKLKNIKENKDIIKNLIEHIKELKDEIRITENEKLEKKEYRQLQVEMRKIELDIQKLENENVTFNNLVNDDSFIEERDYFKQQIIDNLSEIKIKQQKLSIVMNKIHEKEETIEKSSNKNELFEEKNAKIREIKEKVRYYNQIAIYLLNGKSWDQAVNMFLDWQKNKYRIGEKNDSYTIKQDIEQIHKDKIITDEIIDVALLGSAKIREDSDER